MKENLTNSHNNFDEDSIDIIALLKNIWSKRKLIVKATLSFFIIGCIVAILSPIVYTSETIFVPQISDNQMSLTNKGLGSLASLAGIDLNTTKTTSDSYLSPLLYSKIVESEEFSLSVIGKEIINLKGDKFSIKEYLLSKQSSSNFNFMEFIKKYTIGLFLNSEIKETRIGVIGDYNFINAEDFYLINLFEEKFTVELNEKEGYIKVVASDKDAFISSQLVEKVTESLQSKIIKLRTNKIKERLAYSKEQYELKQGEFDFLQRQLAEFKDSN